MAVCTQHPPADGDTATHWRKLVMQTEKAKCECLLSLVCKVTKLYLRTYDRVSGLPCKLALTKVVGIRYVTAKIQITIVHANLGYDV